ncbi:MAG: hypothetical protein QG602_141, partial [Verrucomicrobiota bacterium]|nr:hypothetical protein [Verrucomicrobiota bacterium]
HDISVGSGDLLPDFRLLHLPFDDDEAPDSDRPVVQLPVDFEVENVSAENEHRVECHRIEVSQDGVRFTALLRHGSDRLTTVQLDRELIQAIAAGRSPNLPTAKLTTPTFN